MLYLISWLDKKKLSLSWLAGQINRSRQAVSAWDEVPCNPTLLAKITEITGIPARKLRPDLYPSSVRE